MIRTERNQLIFETRQKSRKQTSEEVKAFITTISGMSVQCLGRIGTSHFCQVKSVSFIGKPQELSTFFKALPCTLKDLTIRNSGPITNKMFLQLGSYCPKLRSLTIDTPGRLSWKGIAGLRLKNKLTHLFLRRCGYLDDKAIAIIAEWGKLEVLELDGCVELKKLPSKLKAKAKLADHPTLFNALPKLRF